jgi:aspartate aminotransferase
MSHPISDRLNRLSESATIAMARKSRELRAQGVDVISLSLGEPDFHTPDFIKEAAKAAIDDNFSSYTAVAGYQELREAIAAKLKRDNGLDYSPNQIVCSTGAKQSLSNVLLALIDPGDEVLLLAPYWVSYREMVKLAEGTPVEILAGVEQEYKFTAEQIDAAITPQTKVVMFNSPSNPTGAVYSKVEIDALVKVFEKHDHVFIMSDEIYEHINFSGEQISLAAYPSIYDRVITVNGLSKGFAMTGWRFGYIAAPEWIAKACDKMQGQMTSATCSITQKAAEAAMRADASSTHEMRDAFRARRDKMIPLFNEIPGFHTPVPEGAFYFFPDVRRTFGKSAEGRTIENATDLSMYLLEVAHVATVPGDAFGAPGCLRMSYAAAEEVLVEAIGRIKKAIEALS